MRSVKDIKPGDVISYKGKPYKIKSKVNVTVGTHCHTKVRIEMEGLFDKKGEVEAFPTHAQVEEVEVIRKKGQVISKLPAHIQVMDFVSYETFDATAAPELFDAVNVGDEVTFLQYEGKNIIVDKR